jgi:hypothetical protein
VYVPQEPPVCLSQLLLGLADPQLSAAAAEADLARLMQQQGGRR